MRDYLGHTITNGRLNFASVSSVKLFDTRTKGGCPRRWHKRYVSGEHEPETDNMIEAKEAGITLDRQMKHYLMTGEKNLSALAIKGLHIMEKPGPNLAVDVKLHEVDYFLNGQPFAKLEAGPNGEEPRYPRGIEVRIRSALSAGGIPFVGELDIVHSRGHYIDDDGEMYEDPPGTIEVADLKYKTYAKDRNGNSTLMLATDLVRDIQMAGYGEWVGRVRPNASRVRLSHLYFPGKPSTALPTKVTRLHVLDDCRRTWEYVDGVVRYMADVAKETDIERVPGADRDMSCDAFRGCPYRETCSAYKKTSLDNLYNKIVEDHIQEKNNMGLIAQTQPGLQSQLAAEEQQMRAQVAQQQQMMPQAFNAAEFLAVCTRLGGYGFGMPTLAGNAAQAYAMAGGQNVAPGFVFQGTMAPAGAPCSLHGVVVQEWQQIYQLERDAAARSGAAQAPASPPAYPPVQVAPNAHPFTQQVAAAYNAGAQVAASVPNFLPPGAPESMPQLAQQQTAPAPAPQPEAEAPKKTRGRPKKEGSGTAPEAGAAPPSSQAPQTAAAPPGSPPGAATQVAPAAGPTSMYSSAALDSGVALAPAKDTGAILINARYSNKATKSLAGYVDYINGELAKRYSVLPDGKPGIQDVRCVPKDSPLAFGGWKGAVREIVKADPPAPNDYHLDTFMDDLNEAVADALRVVAEARGWLYVRGVR